MTSQPDESNVPQTTGRLWTPWRMQYVGGEREAGCIFCNRFNAADDVRSLILHRTDLAFVIMNLFPYNSGHVMIVPAQHIASPEDADPEQLRAMADLLPGTLKALRRSLSCHGFNVGLNVGAVAGAGIAEHMHQHLVPRWIGDASFMPVLGSVMVMPELIPVTYAKARAEFAREFGGAAEAVRLVVFSPNRERVVVDRHGHLPLANLQPEQATWQSALKTARSLGVTASVVGWAGPSHASTGGIGLTMLASEASEPSTDWRSIEQIEDEAAQQTIERALTQLAPEVDREYQPE